MTRWDANGARVARVEGVAPVESLERPPEGAHRACLERLDDRGRLVNERGQHEGPAAHPDGQIGEGRRDGVDRLVGIVARKQPPVEHELAAGRDRVRKDGLADELVGDERPAPELGVCSRLEAQVFQPGEHVRDDRDGIGAALRCAGVRGATGDLDDDVDTAAVAKRDRVSGSHREDGAGRERIEPGEQARDARVARTALGADREDDCALRIVPAVAQQTDRLAGRGQAGLPLAGTEPHPDLLTVDLLRARPQRIGHVVAVVDRGVADEQQLSARQLAPAGDDVVQGVDLDRRSELLQGRDGSLVHEAHDPLVLRVEPRLAVAHGGVERDEAGERVPEVAHRRRGRIVLPNASTSSSGSVYEPRWRM